MTPEIIEFGLVRPHARDPGGYLRNPEAARSLGKLMALGERARAHMALGAAPHDLLACARRGLAASQAAGLPVEIVEAYFAGYEDARSQEPSLPTLFVALRNVSAS
jgi:hypothetical protein